MTNIALCLYNNHVFVGYFDSKEDINKYINLQEKLGSDISKYNIREKEIYI